MRKLKLFLAVLMIALIFLFNCNNVTEEEEEKTPNPIIAEHTAGTVSLPLTWGINSSSNKIEWTQSFQISSNSTCSAVEIHLGPRTGTPIGNYEIKIETNNTDQPSGTLVDANATKVIPVSGLTDNAWNKWTFDSSFILTANTTYWIVCRTDEPGPLENRMTIARLNPEIYSLGYIAYYLDGLFQIAYPTYDMNFKVYR